jgi:signal transduction histidine kinase
LLPSIPTCALEKNSLRADNPTLAPSLMSKATSTPDPLLIVGTTGLAAGVFALDLWLPLGVAVGVLYWGVVLIALASPQRWFPLIVTGACSILIIVGALLGPILPGVPLWMAVTNRLLSLIVIWVPVVVLLERRRGVEALRQAYDELEKRVQERTAELVKANKALEAEIAERKRAEASLWETQHALERNRWQLRALAAQLLTAQDDERRRISRELHDDLNQRLAMLAVEIETFQQRLPSPNLIAEKLRSLHEQVVELSDDVRHLAYQFHPSILDDLGLPIALQRYIEDFGTRTGINVTLVHKDLPDPLPQDIASCLYRVAQESLGNVAKHAHASHAAVELLGSEAGVSLSVRDSGVGFDPATVKQPLICLGITSMKERVRLVNGRLEVKSSPGQGTEVRVWIPLPGNSP